MLGVIDIGISLAEIDREIAVIRRNTMVMASIALLALFGFVACLRPAARRAAGDRAGGSHAKGGGRRLHAGSARDQVRKRARRPGALVQRDGRRALTTARAERQALLETLEHQVEERTAALKDAQAQLVQSEKLSSLGRLAASIAHEINNPLAGILTYAKLLVRMLETEPVDEATRATSVKHLKLVQRETERCTAIVRNLLDFARQRPLSLKDVDCRRRHRRSRVAGRAPGEAAGTHHRAGASSRCRSSRPTSASCARPS